MKRTLPRIAVWNELKKNRIARSAQAISDSLRSDDPGCCLATVYRILEAFEKSGVVIRSRTTDRMTAFFALASNTDTHYAICVQCNTILPVEGCPCELQMPHVDDGSFHVTGHRFELIGYCDDCYKKKVADPKAGSATCHSDNS